MPQRWNKLPSSTRAPIPPLLYRFIATSQAYEFYLTDLTYIWSERLSHKEILQKAEDAETSIDPSEDATQFDVFLQKIRDALEAVASSGVDVASSREPNLLEVTTTTQLPRGLNPLKWTFVLSLESPAEFTRHLLLPLLKSEGEHQKRERELLGPLADKDKILSKIFDKIDASQLADIFPGVAGPRGANPRISDLLKHVKGAARFDEAEWRKEIPSGELDAMTAGSIVDQTSKFLGLAASNDLQFAGQPWWQRLSEKKTSFRQLSQKEQPPVQSNLPTAKKFEQETLGVDDSTEDEGEFQRQKTPPHLRRDNATTNEKPIEDDHASTESDEEVEPVSKKERSPPGPQQKKQQVKGLGRIGASRVTTQLSRSESPPSPASTTSTDAPKLSNIPPADEETESDSVSPWRETHRIPSSANEKPVMPKRKGGLGKIGGKKPEPVTEPLRHESPQQASAKTMPTQPPKKLGTIGAKKKPPITGLPLRETISVKEGITASEDEGDDLDSAPKTTPAKLKLQKSSLPRFTTSKSPSPIPKKLPSSEPEEELSAQQRADKKREELKRQLDARSKAPQKKKRKF
ncbi:XRCC4-like factor-domain-containing protein [Talaromyces proteolyticus]|uniref:Non-homologous end-joining factor 1 n=1 Tax=Talaromyces proteolyticus TaxID=1131652 RepID=A0AAD4Q2H7_9EURO|nr:XRCC4-like factor-domain-containing protein [Talaromyces proteolyticus]KAH8700343.1 XRCC4-like factor-domain-containing protein [Talaromyces proteolyticus]